MMVVLLALFVLLLFIWVLARGLYLILKRAGVYRDEKLWTRGVRGRH